MNSSLIVQIVSDDRAGTGPRKSRRDAPWEGFLLSVQRRRTDRVAALALAPALVLFLTIYVGCTAYSIYLSTTASKLLPNHRFVGLSQYEALFTNARWHEAIGNIAVYGPLFVGVSLVVGVLTAIMIDQKIRGEAVFRSLILYPYATSFIVTGLLWNWIFDPGRGIGSILRGLGLDVRAEWIVDPDTVVLTLVVAAVWHSSGLVMAITLAGLRGIDEDIWKALKVDGVPKWLAYAKVIVPMLGASIASSVVLLAIGVVKVYDLVVAMTHGGPGFASDMPAKFVMDNLFDRQNVGLATAATTVMLVAVVAVLTPWFFVQRNNRSRKAA